jgi:hypothetical protein
MDTLTCAFPSRTGGDPLLQVLTYLPNKLTQVSLRLENKLPRQIYRTSIDMVDICRIYGVCQNVTFKPQIVPVEYKMWCQGSYLLYVIPYH